MDKIIVLVIFSCDGVPTIPQVHYYHDNSAICARFCYSSGERFRSSCPAPIIIVVLPCGSSRAERLCDPSELRVRYLTHHRLGRALRSPTAGSAGSGRKPSRGISRHSVLIRRPALPPTFSAAALAVSAAIDCEHVDARCRELRRHSGPRFARAIALVKEDHAYIKDKLGCEVRAVGKGKIFRSHQHERSEKAIQSPSSD